MAAATELDTPLIAMPAQRGKPSGRASFRHDVPPLWDDTGALDLSDLSGPDSCHLDGSGPPDAPLTSEPPLADTAPLTAEQPLAAQLPLTAEPTGSGLHTDDRGASDTTDLR